MIGRDLNKSLIATSNDAQTIEPIASAKQYNALTKVNAENKKNKINKPLTINDCNLCFLSSEEKTKFSLAKNSFILPLHP